MKKGTLLIAKYIDLNIKAGDKIRIVDGSAFTPLEYSEKDYYIVNSYPELTGIDKKIKEIIGEVIFTGLESNVVLGLERVYLQDCIIQLGNGLFRTCSKFLRKV